MKNRSYIYTFLIIIFVTFVLTFTPVYALVGDENPDRPIIDDGTGNGSYGKGSTKTLDNVLNILFFGGFNSYDDSEGSDSDNDSTNPTPTTNPNITGVPYTGTFKYYRQCDYRTTPLGSGGSSCTICKAGCGLVSSAGILSTLVSPSIDPPTVVGLYTANNLPSSCAGSTTESAKYLMDCFDPIKVQEGHRCYTPSGGGTIETKLYEKYGTQLQTTDFLFNYDAAGESAVDISKVADDIRPYLKQGWFVFALANFCETGCGHFFVLTDIDDYNNVTSFDPYYMDGSRFKPASTSQPINYTISNPFPKYRVAFAVKKK